MIATGSTQPWARDIFDVLKEHGVSIVSYVPDAGHADLIELCRSDPDVTDVLLTTEQEGVALAAGAHLGGRRAALLMQSSGAGNCINMLSLIETCGMPFLTLVAMRGEWGESNPWQVPMGRATGTALATMGVIVDRVDEPDDVRDVVDAATRMAFASSCAVAVLLSQRLIGAKRFGER